MMSKVRTAQIEMAEAMVKAIIEQAGPSALVAAINNVCCHGYVFIEQDLHLDKDDMILGQWYDGLEQMKLAAEKMES